ncbi:MAG: peptidoglycan editing factor PgeF [Oscillospiraceae bacterium]|jgi:YfiH family protein|nr:peptidoglycan editing factor PgeF [Oscillospiraceae bacterium]
MGTEHFQMDLCRSGTVEYLAFPAFQAYPFVRHAFSTRIGGISRNEFSSMNLAFGRGDPKENVLENYRRFCSAAGFDFASLVSSAQDHHTVIRRVGRRDCGLGFWKTQDKKSVDGLITDEPGVTLVTHYADCVPVFLVDPVRRAVGLVHAGWRGTAAKIGAAAVTAMAREFGSRPQDLAAGIGPSIGPCCFEVDRPVRDAFAALTELHPEGFIRADGNGKYHIDLWEANRRILLESGLSERRITVAGICTRCHSELLFSHRASGGKRGGLAAFMAVKEDV